VSVLAACATITNMPQDVAEVELERWSGETRRLSTQNSESAGQRTARWLRVSYRFLTREQARKSWFVFVACVAVASLPWTAHWHEVQQGVIVLASLAAGSIFMPELNSGLWRLKAQEIRDTIPQHRRRQLFTELIRADCADDEWAQRWATLMWRRGVLPLLDAGHDARLVHWNVTYEVSVHLGREVRVGSRRVEMARIETRNDYERVFLPAKENTVWVSVAGNDASLLSEFNADRCLTRELVALPGLTKEAWADEVRKLCQVRVRIGPRVIDFRPDEVVTVPGDEDVKIVRWLVPIVEADMTGEPVACQVEIHFPAEIRENNFPVVLAGYYCAGRTVLSFKLYHDQAPRPALRYFDEFLSEGGGNVDAWKPERFDTEDRQSVTYRTPEGSLLWPGSGIYFWWETSSDEVAHRLQ
jgi:hypothetical protein